MEDTHIIGPSRLVQNYVMNVKIPCLSQSPEPCELLFAKALNTCLIHVYFLGEK